MLKILVSIFQTTVLISEIGIDISPVYTPRAKHGQAKLVYILNEDGHMPHPNKEMY
jgi:hypothetical protein